MALIDSGAASSPSGVLAPALAELGMDLSDVDMVLNTHGHLDHAGGNAGMKKSAPRVQIRIHQADAPLATDLAAEIEFHAAPLRQLGFPRSVIEARAEYVAAAAGEEKAAVDGFLAEGTVVDLGMGIRLQVVHLPGHTPGHVAFFWSQEGIVLAADAVQGQGSRAGGYPYYFDAIRYRESVARLSSLDCQTLCLSHGYVGGGPISDPTRRGSDVRAFLDESARVADAIQKAVEMALARLPGASRREIALDALRELVYELPQQRVRETDMPSHAGPALNAHIEAALSGGYPVGL